MPSTSGIFAAGSLIARRRRRGRADRADGAGAVPGAAAVVVGIGAAQPRADLEADDEGRERLRRRRAGALGERQERGDDRREQLALGVGEVEVERVRGDPVRQRRELRRGAQRLPDDRGRGRGALRAHELEHDRGGLAAASRQHHPDGVDEGQARALDRERGHGFEVEARDEFGDDVAQPLRLAGRTAWAPARRRRVLASAGPAAASRVAAPAPRNSRRST